jgi:hypothetical protein
VGTEEATGTEIAIRIATETAMPIETVGATAKRRRAKAGPNSPNALLRDPKFPRTSPRRSAEGKRT